MNTFDVLQAVSAFEGCKVGDIDDGQELLYALCHGLVNCVDGRLYLTKLGATEYRGMRDSRSVG